MILRVRHLQPPPHSRLPLVEDFRPSNIIKSTDKWRSAERVLESIRSFAPIGLDPTGNFRSTVGARRQYHVEKSEDGLLLPWYVWPGEIAYFNPPYSVGNLDAWTAKAAREWLENGFPSIGSLPADISTSWYQDNVHPMAAARCWWRGRVSHVGSTYGSPKFGTLLAYNGPEPERFAAHFAGWGRVDAKT